MDLSQRQKRFSFLSVLALVAVFILTACGGESTSAASCAFVVGTGGDTGDRSLHDIVYPGQKVEVGGDEKIEYFPCNSRNYIINDGTVKNVNDERIGDRFEPILAYTESGTAILVSITAFFTLNQDQDALAKFYNVCHKHTCASKEESAGDVNNSTGGWIDLLDENLGPALESSTRSGAKTVTDEIWRTQDATQYDVLSDYVSANLNDSLRVRFGYQEDLFCGSGNSDWTDASKPGEGEFSCSPVRIEVTAVQLAPTGDDGSEGTTAVNEQRLDNAEALYGEDAGYWLGVQDTVQQCKDAGVTCVFNIGESGNSPGVAIPVTTPVPPTEEPVEEDEG